MSDGIVFSYRGSWCAEGQNTNWDSSWRLIGNRGTVTWDGNDSFHAQAVKPGANTGFIRELDTLSVPITPLAASGHQGVMTEFISALKQGRKPETDCEDNIQSLAMVLAAVESAKTGRKMPVVW
jgi:predicted dehydrogenase